MNQAALNAIVDGFHYWLLKTSAEVPLGAGEKASNAALTH